MNRADTNTAIQHLIAVNDIDAAAFDEGLARLQAVIGQTAGDVAGIFFSGMAPRWEAASLAG